MQVNTPSVARTLYNNFADFDRNKSGFIERSELNAVANNGLNEKNPENVVVAQHVKASPIAFGVLDSAEYGKKGDERIGKGDLKAAIEGRIHDNAWEQAESAKPNSTTPTNNNTPVNYSNNSSDTSSVPQRYGQQINNQSQPSPKSQPSESQPSQKSQPSESQPSQKSQPSQSKSSEDSENVQNKSPVVSKELLNVVMSFLSQLSGLSDNSSKKQSA